MRILLIDDLRDLNATVIARTYQEGIDQLLNNGPWDLLRLDHDLASFDEHGKEQTGYDVMLFIEEQFHNGNVSILPGKIELVTSNPVGRQRMLVVIGKLYEGK